MLQGIGKTDKFYSFFFFFLKHYLIYHLNFEQLNKTSWTDVIAYCFVHKARKCLFSNFCQYVHQVKKRCQQNLMLQHSIQISNVHHSLSTTLECFNCKILTVAVIAYQKKKS